MIHSYAGQDKCPNTFLHYAAPSSLRKEGPGFKSRLGPLV